MSPDAADDDRPRGLGERSAEGADESRYFGPFAPPPSFHPPGSPSAYETPSAMAPGPGPWPPPTPESQPNRRARGGAGILIAAVLLALVVGGAAGFGGSRLADLSASPGGAASPSAVDSSRTDPAPSEPAPSPDSTSEPPAPAPTTAPPDPTRPRQIDTVTVARTVLPGTVMIQARDGDRGATGSGFVIDAAGRIVTNNHVVARAASGGRITVTFADGRRSAATLIGRSPSYDIAVIKVAASRQLRPIPLGNSDAAQVGEPVVAVGSPLGLPGTVTQGIISAKNRPVVVDSDEEADGDSAFISGIQTDAPINPGNSGGPLVDAGGRVIGVNSAILTLGGQTQTGNIGLGFAIPIKQASAIARELIAEGKATYPVIGANVGRESARGVELESVDAGGPAARAGLRVGDLVTRIDSLPVSTGEELIVAIRTHRPGEKVTLSYARGSDRGRAVITLGSREG